MPALLTLFLPSTMVCRSGSEGINECGSAGAQRTSTDRSQTQTVCKKISQTRVGLGHVIRSALKALSGRK
jgi:hypothetical protein